VELNACGQNKLTDRLAEAALAFATGLLSRVNSRVSIDEISLSYRRRYASEIQEPLQYTLALRTPETTDFVELSAKIESALNVKTLRVKATKCDTDLRNVIVYSLPEGVPYEDKVIWEPLVLSVRLP
jgi:hypothetical protein